MTKALELKPQAMPEFGREQVELLKRTIAKGASDDELQLFIGIAKRTGLDPFARQIYAIRRWDAREKREVMQPQTSIDGLRLIADRSGRYEGQEGPLWCGKDGVWRDVWLPDAPPGAARVGVLKSGCRAPFFAVAKYTEYVQLDRDGHPISMWRKMPANQLAKCAEALALRKAFPQELSGLYSSDEMPAAEDEPPLIAESPQKQLANGLDKPWTSFKGMIEAFAVLHARLGADNESVYREVLRAYGVEHSNKFRDSAKAVLAYHELLGRVEAIEGTAQAAEDFTREEEPEA